MGIPCPKPKFKRLKPTQTSRSNFSKAVREEIFKRDDHCCVLCGRWSSIIHHVMFRSHGGRGVVSNGVTICQDCHDQVHQHHIKSLMLQRKMRIRYGPDYFRDEWDGA